MTELLVNTFRARDFAAVTTVVNRLYPIESPEVTILDRTRAMCLGLTTLQEARRIVDAAVQPMPTYTQSDNLGV